MNIPWDKSHRRFDIKYLYDYNTKYCSILYLVIAMMSNSGMRFTPGYLDQGHYCIGVLF